MRKMLPHAAPDLAMAVEVPEVNNEDGIDIDHEITSIPFGSSGVDVVDSFDLPYSFSASSSASSSSENHRAIGPGPAANSSSSSSSRGGGRRSGRSSSVVTTINSDDNNISISDPSIHHRGAGRLHEELNDPFDELLMNTGWKYLKKICSKCIHATGQFCWDSLSYQNLSDEFLWNTTNICGVSAAALTSLQAYSHHGGVPSRYIGAHGILAVNRVTEVLVPALTCSSIASSLLLICKSISNSEMSFGPIVNRATRFVSRYQLPQVITFFSMFIAIYAWRARVELRNMQWLIRIWVSKYIGQFRG